MASKLKKYITWSTPLKVLILGEDLTGDAGNSIWYKPTIVTTLEAVQTELLAHQFDAVLVPVSEAQSDGLALPSILLDMRKQGRLLRLPNVFWCGTFSECILAPHVRLARAEGVSVHVLSPMGTDTVQDVSRLLAAESPELCHSFFTVPLEVTEYDLLCALLSGCDFRIVLQPQVDLRSGRYVGAEALSRWKHPELGEISPSTFVPIANKARLNLLLFHFVEAQVIELLCTLKRQGIEIPISVNASAETLRTKGMSSRLMQRLASAGVTSSMLKIELTEDVLVGDMMSLSAALSGMRVCGFPIALDDFGCGGATLDLLTKLPFSEVKIDGNFVRKMRSEPGCKAAVLSAISIANEMSIDCIAEGIETPEQLKDLLFAGCKYGQGFALSPPLEVSKFIEAVACNALGEIST